MDPGEWTTKEVLLWASACRLSSAIAAYIQDYDVSGVELMQ